VTGLGALLSSTMATSAITVDGTRLTCEQVAAVARDGAQVNVAVEGIQRAHAAARVVRQVATRRPVYGRTTGVGANRTTEVESGDAHGLHLLRSHASGTGPLLARPYGRAMLVVRLNQLAAGGSGVDAAMLDVLAGALNRGLAPPVHAYGSIGTADVVALASTALCILGEQPWQGGSMAPFAMDPGDALAFMSSNAATVGTAALFCRDLRERLDAGLVTAALSCLAVDASREHFAAVVHQACPHPGQQGVAAGLRALLADDAGLPRRVQDPFSYRALPQVHGPAVDAAEHLDRLLAIEMNGAAENPLVDVSSNDVYHNGNFHNAYVAVGLDAARIALFQTAALSTARLATLFEPQITGLRPFLADGPAADSGAMILEYVAHSALADLRQRAAPAAIGIAVLSRGVEEHASFSTQAARSGGEALTAYDAVLSCELVAAVRALHLRGVVPTGTRLRRAHTQLSTQLDPRTEDRPLSDDLAIAARALPGLASLVH